MVGVSQGSRLALCSKGIFEACAGPGQENPVGKDANATRLRNACNFRDMSSICENVHPCKRTGGVAAGASHCRLAVWCLDEVRATVSQVNYPP